MERWKQSRGLLKGARKILEKYRTAAHDFLDFPFPLPLYMQDRCARRSKQEPYMREHMMIWTFSVVYVKQAIEPSLSHIPSRSSSDLSIIRGALSQSQCLGKLSK